MPAGRVSQVRNKPESAATTAELLEILGVGRTTFYRYIERGILLPPEGYTAKFGRQARWSAAAVARVRKVRALIDQGYTLEAIAAKVAE